MLISRSAYRALAPSISQLLNKQSFRFCSDDDFKKQSKVEITNENAQKMIKKWVKGNDIVLFMKGTPEIPRCGYSAQVVEILKKYGKHHII